MLRLDSRTVIYATSRHKPGDSQQVSQFGNRALRGSRIDFALALALE